MNTPQLAQLRAKLVEISGAVSAALAILDTLSPPEVKKEEPIWMRVKDYAARRQVGTSTIARWLRLGLPHKRIGRVLRIDVRAADAWAEPEAIRRNAEKATARGGR